MTVGNMQYGANNNADTDNTYLTSLSGATLYITNDDPKGNGVVGNAAGGVGVYGMSAHIGVFGFSPRHGVEGWSTNDVGVYGKSDKMDGVQGWAQSADASGVYGSTNVGYGVTGRAEGKGVGVRARSSEGYGVWAETSTGGVAILGETSGTGAGVYGSSIQGTGVVGVGGTQGVLGQSSSNRGNGVTGLSYGNQGADAGVRGEARGSDGTGVAGVANRGRNAFGIYGESNEGSAGLFSGNVKVYGDLWKASGGFLIDHINDPANKYLRHSFVESPDRMNVYNGNVTTDGNGDATVALPSYFEALNRDFRYQLTVIGQFAQAIIAEECTENRFVIKSDKPNVRVSWQVTGVRQDAYAKAHPFEVEIDKPEDERGTYLMPEEHGQSPTLGVLHKRQQPAPEQTLEPILNDEYIGTLREQDELILNRKPSSMERPDSGA